MSWATATGFQLNRIPARRFEKCTCRAEAASWSQPVGKPNSQSNSVPKRPSTAAPGDSSKAIEAKSVVSSTNVTRRGRCATASDVFSSGPQSPLHLIRQDSQYILSCNVNTSIVSVFPPSLLPPVAHTLLSFTV